MPSKGNARIPYSLGEFGAFVFCPISVFTLLLSCFLSLLLDLSSSLSFEDISEGALQALNRKYALETRKEAFVYLQREVIIGQASHFSARHSSARPAEGFIGLCCPISADKTLPLEKVSYLMKQGA